MVRRRSGCRRREPRGGRDHASWEHEAIRETVARTAGWVRQARGENVFQGIEHVGLYPYGGASAQQIVDWYREVFGFDIDEGKAYYFVQGQGPGRIEVMKAGQTDRCHIAIKVADIEAASAVIRSHGIDLVPAETRPDGRKIFLTVNDPAGNIVHIVP